MWCADRATHKSHSAESQKLSNHCHSLPQAPLFSPFTLLPKHHVFHAISISLMLRTFRPFSSPQTTPPLSPEPMKYPLAISLTVPANSPLPWSYPHAQPMQLSLQLTAPGIHQHLVCSAKTAADQGSNWQTVCGMREPTITDTALYSQLCLEQFHRWCVFAHSSSGV